MFSQPGGLWAYRRRRILVDNRPFHAAGMLQPGKVSLFCALVEGLSESGAIAGRDWHAAAKVHQWSFSFPILPGSTPFHSVNQLAAEYSRKIRPQNAARNDKNTLKSKEQPATRRCRLVYRRKCRSTAASGPRNYLEVLAVRSRAIPNMNSQLREK
jgi:hypothetical protein